jgi:FHS family L-fucose permease-like MFS transporter
MGVGGGMLIPPVEAVIKDHSNINYAFIVTLFCFVTVFAYATVGHRWIRYVDEELEASVPVEKEHQEVNSNSGSMIARQEKV